MPCPYCFISRVLSPYLFFNSVFFNHFLSVFTCIIQIICIFAMRDCGQHKKPSHAPPYHPIWLFSYIIVSFWMQIILSNLVHWFGSPFNPLNLLSPSMKVVSLKFPFGKYKIAILHPGFFAQCFKPSRH